MNASAAAASPPPLSAEFVRALDRVPNSRLITRTDHLRPYECDGLAAYRSVPGAVVIPDNETAVQAILKLCHQHRVPVVPRGAGTGLSGGALPIAGGLVLSLARLDKILNINPNACTATVQCGVRNISVSEAAKPYGLYYAPDPSSQIACTIGGNVSENSGGVHCLKYGLTLHNVLKVRAITLRGEIVEFGSLAPDTPGLDLLSVLIGSEGMFAVVTEITVKLTPIPATARVIMASFDDVVKGGDAVASLISNGIIPAGLEMMDKGAIHAVEQFAQAGYDLNAEAILLCESDGAPAEVEEEIGRMKAILLGAGATGIEVSQSEQQRVLFWSGRKAAFPAAGRVSPDYYCMDGTVPRRSVGPLLSRISRMSEHYGLRCINVFHAGDGNMHPLILFNGADPDEWERAERFGSEIIETCVELGGSITGEHGVGLEKINSMCVQFSPAENALFHEVKAAFDPDRLLNPDKGIPTKARCAEYGKMHIRGGVIPFPEIPRF
tara:strand:+ start:20498 stop:21982 length:1485 start_codon:yes stop_codon:yes gene_type:complete